LRQRSRVSRAIGGGVEFRRGDHDKVVELAARGEAPNRERAADTPP